MMMEYVYYIPIDILVDKKDKYIVEPGNIMYNRAHQLRIGLMNVKDGKSLLGNLLPSGKGCTRTSSKENRESDKDFVIHLNTILKEDNCSLTFTFVIYRS